MIQARAVECRPYRPCESDAVRTPKKNEVDPLMRPGCGGTMKILAVIERPAIIRQILAHLGLAAVAPSLRAPPDPPVNLAGDHPREWSYEPFLDDLPVPDPMLG